MVSESQYRPLVTFALLAYKQEPFIREAIEGAFAQTYSPLEIILSDDCSPDGTFRVMEEMVRTYTGPHRIRLNRTPVNLGLSAHLDSIMKTAEGEWIVLAAGDDISLPERVVEHMAIARVHPDSYSIFLAPIPFGDSAQGRVPVVPNQVLRYPDSLKTYGGGVLGATHAFRRSVWEVFGDLGPGIIIEDWVVPFRSSLLGTVVWSDHPGVHYRVHGDSITSKFFGRLGCFASAEQIRIESISLEARWSDLKKATEMGIIPRADGEAGMQWLKSVLNTNKIIVRCIEAENIVKWVFSAIKLVAYRGFIGSWGRRAKVIQLTLLQQVSRLRQARPFGSRKAA